MQTRWKKGAGAVLLLTALGVAGCGGSGSFFEGSAGATTGTAMGAGSGAATGAGIETGAGTGAVITGMGSATGTARGTVVAGEVPGSALANVSGFVAYAMALVNSHSETASPVALENVTLPTDDRAAPSPIQ